MGSPIRLRRNPGERECRGGLRRGRVRGHVVRDARLENRFEKGLEKVTAEYSLLRRRRIGRRQPGIRPQERPLREATGKAYFVGPPMRGRLKVSFFGPFYGAYNIISLDENYGWSLVCGKDYAYLWILSTPQLPGPVVKQLIEKAKGLGFKTDAGVCERRVRRGNRIAGTGD